MLGEGRRPAPHASCTCGALAHAPRTGFSREIGFSILMLILIVHARNGI